MKPRVLLALRADFYNSMFSARDLERLRSLADIFAVGPEKPAGPVPTPEPPGAQCVARYFRTKPTPASTIPAAIARPVFVFTLASAFCTSDGLAATAGARLTAGAGARLATARCATGLAAVARLRDERCEERDGEAVFDFGVLMAPDYPPARPRERWRYTTQAEKFAYRPLLKGGSPPSGSSLVMLAAGAASHRAGVLGSKITNGGTVKLNR